MDLVLLDTDVFSMFFRRDSRSFRYDEDVRGKVCCLSVASVAELLWGHRGRLGRTPPPAA